ncbi:glycosyltransferase family 2 protein [Bacteroides congonensis]
MRTPFLSLIIPIYNKEKYIDKCLESILCQSFQDFELVVVDDGSTDGSVEKIKAFDDNRIHLFCRSNSGVSCARNYGILNARGEYIVFIDSDDYIDEDFVETLHQMWNQHPDSDVFLYGLKKCDKNGNVLGKYYSEVSGFQNWDDFYRTFMIEQGRKGVYGYVSTKMIRRKFLNRHNIRFDENIRLAEDYNFYLDVFMKRPVIFFSNYCGYNYVQEVENSSFQQRNIDYFSLIRIWMKTVELLRGKDGFAENEMMIREKIIGLYEALFLEMTKIKYSNISVAVARLHEMENSVNAFVKRRTYIQRWIADKRIFCLYMYLIMRKLFHLIRDIK